MSSWAWQAAGWTRAGTASSSSLSCVLPRITWPSVTALVPALVYRAGEMTDVATHVAPPRNPSSSSTRLFPGKNSVALPARECVPCRKEERCAAPLLSSLGSFRHVFSQVCPLCLARFDAVLEGKRCLGFVWLTCTALQCFFF